MEKGPGPVPFILQEGKLRLWEETDLLNQDHKASQRQGPILLRPRSETMPGSVLEALQISMH